MNKEEIKKLKEAIKDGWHMANDPLCSKGFEAANKLIEFYETKFDRKSLLKICYEVFEKAFDIGYDWSHYESISEMQECTKKFIAKKILEEAGIYKEEKDA